MREPGLSSVSYELIAPSKVRLLSVNRLLLVSIFVFLFWSAFAELDVMIFANGQVVTTSSVKKVQHFEGGIVAEIYVQQGGVVAAGDPLLRVDNVNINTQLAETQNRLFGIEAELARLSAVIEDKSEPEFDQMLVQALPELVDSQYQQFIEDRRNFEQQSSSLNYQIENSRQAEAEVAMQIELAEKSSELMSQELEVSRGLLSQGAISEVEVLQLSRNLISLQSENQRLNTQYFTLQSDTRRLQQELNQLQGVRIGEAISRRNELQAVRNEMLEVMTGATDRSDRSLVRSPVDGVVNQILINTLGGVVQSGMDLVEIVPLDEDYLIDAKIMPEDIGALVIGQPANVRLTAYDFSIFGSLPGTLEYIGADTLEEQDGSQYYLAQIRIDSELVSQDTQYPVLSGMIASVDIITGKRTVLSYITKPIVKTKERALREQ